MNDVANDRVGYMQALPLIPGRHHLTNERRIGPLSSGDAPPAREEERPTPLVRSFARTQPIGACDIGLACTARHRSSPVFQTENAQLTRQDRMKAGNRPRSNSSPSTCGGRSWPA